MLGKKNVKKDPSKDFNASEDFFFIVIKGFILSAALEAFQMGYIDEYPQHMEDWIVSDIEKRKQVMSSLCDKIISKFVRFSYAYEGSHIKNSPVLEYAVQLLSSGLFYFEYHNAIREGDGERVYRC